MSLNFSANQYEDAYNSKKLQNWTLPKHHREKSPWGKYMGTWDMPLKIPPAKVSLASRSARAANHLTEWICNSTALTSASNGLRPEIDGEAVRPRHKGIPTGQLSATSRRCFSQSPEKTRCSVLQPEQGIGAPSGKLPEGRSSRRPTPQEQGTCEVPKSTSKMESEICNVGSPKNEMETQRSVMQGAVEDPSRPLSPKNKWMSHQPNGRLMMQSEAQEPAAPGTECNIQKAEIAAPKDPCPIYSWKTE
ncbi:protein Flattop isoform X2 [Ambystoma mexicanum]|uniref:protein Flattop isoform X2 n=1 Tax=Ambystoma mexicanum TaxID=8296 RepID=UPI0037E99D78